jgi:cytochrome P450
MLSRWSPVKQIDPLKKSTRDIIVHSSANVFAGSDTTAIALRAIIYYLCKTPSAMEKMVDENRRKRTSIQQSDFVQGSLKFAVLGRCAERSYGYSP